MLVVMVCGVVGARNEGSNSAASARSTGLPHFRTKARMELKIRGQSSVNIQISNGVTSGAICNAKVRAGVRTSETTLARTCALAPWQPHKSTHTRDGAENRWGEMFHDG